MKMVCLSFPIIRVKNAITFIWTLLIVRDRTQDGNLDVIYSVWIVEPITITIGG